METVGSPQLDKPLVSIVIPAWNAENYIGKCVQSCVEQTYPAFEIVVVDNGSSDKTGAIAREVGGVRLLRLVRLEENAGFTGGANAGIRAASGAFVVLLNSDAEIDKDYVENAVAAFSTGPRVGAVGGRVYDCRGTTRLHSLQSAGNYIVSYMQLRTYPADVLSDGETIFGPPSPIMMFAKEALEDVRMANGDYFDMRFWCFGEDIDLLFRLARRDWSSVFASRCVGWHEGSMSFGGKVRMWDKSPPIQRIATRNVFFVIIGTLPPSMVLGDLTAVMAVDFLRLLMCGMKNRKSVAACILGHWDALRMFPSLLKKRREISRHSLVKGRTLYARILRDRWRMLMLRLKKLFLSRSTSPGTVTGS